MFISAAYAASDAAMTSSSVADAATGSAGEAFFLNMSLVLVLVVMFYVLLIIPQQRRFREHRKMVDSMQKGDKVLTAGGFIGVVDSVDAEKNQVVVDLGNGVKVTALRATIQTRIEDSK